MVELVIIIAVIAILAAVLIPTFSSIIKKSRQSAALQEVNSAYKDAYRVVIADGKIEEGEGIAVNLFEFTFTENGEDVTIVPQTNSPYHGFEFDFTDGAVAVVD